MAMKSDSDYPRLTPPDDRYPDLGSLFRTPGDFDAGQFDLLAASWAEESLTGDSLAEFESVLVSDPAKRAYAESFMKLRLIPGKEKWRDRNNLLRSTPLVTNLRRTLMFTIAAAAAILAIISLKPVAEQQAKMIFSPALPELTIVSDSEKAPLDVKTKEPGQPSAENVSVNETFASSDVTPAENNEIKRTDPVVVSFVTEFPVIIAGLTNNELKPLNIKETPSPEVMPAEQNWMVKGLAVLSRTKPREGKPTEGRNVADSFVKGVNTVLGWEMELEEVKSNEGDPVSVSFTSGLLTFSSPVKKSNQ